MLGTASRNGVAAPTALTDATITTATALSMSLLAFRHRTPRMYTD